MLAINNLSSNIREYWLHLYRRTKHYVKVSQGPLITHITMLIEDLSCSKSDKTRLPSVMHLKLFDVQWIILLIFCLRLSGIFGDLLTNVEWTCIFWEIPGINLAFLWCWIKLGEMFRKNVNIWKWENLVYEE